MSVSISCNRDSTHIFCNCCNQDNTQEKRHRGTMCHDVMVTPWKDQTTVEAELAGACSRMISHSCVYNLDHASTNKCLGIRDSCGNDRDMGLEPAN